MDKLVRAGDLEIDLGRRLVRRRGEVIPLSRTEWLLLQYLAANAGKVMRTAEILNTVWGPEYGDDVQRLRVWVSRLRRKLGASEGESPVVIKTVQGIGYMLDAEPPPPAPAASR
ncbi:MAG: winged helix-turn-helix domain-containing protein [Chloroflexi bacterium]|nr:winged helix-turn-helix domain-containing protein [Chloroflexota bacterium]